MTENSQEISCPYCGSVAPDAITDGWRCGCGMAGISVFRLGKPGILDLGSGWFCQTAPSEGDDETTDTTDQQAVTVTQEKLATRCDGKEQYAFEAWAAAERYDMNEHPLHYLFLNEKTAAARDGWAAGLKYASDIAVRLASVSSASVERSLDNFATAMKYVQGERETIAQPTEAATDLALTATPEDFPRDSYDLARWLDRAMLAASPESVPATNQAGEVDWTRTKAFDESAAECMRAAEASTFADTVSEDERKGYRSACNLLAMNSRVMASRAAPEWLTPEPASSNLDRFIAEIHKATPNGEYILVQHHPNGDWSVSRKCEPVPATNQAGEVERRVSRWRNASVALGGWLSAALDDPKVCAEMKADIQEWFSAGEPFAALATQPATSQEGERWMLRERIDTVLHMSDAKPLTGELSDIALTLLREAAAQLAVPSATTSQEREDAAFFRWDESSPETKTAVMEIFRVARATQPATSQEEKS